MRRRRAGLALTVIALVILTALVVWQGSFSFGDYAPSSPQQTFVYWAVSTLVFLLTVTLGFMLFRTAVKLYVERLSNREGSRIKTKLVFGALTLSFVPVLFLVLMGYAILNRNLEKWFTRPAEDLKVDLMVSSTALDGEVRQRVKAQAKWISMIDEMHAVVEGAAPSLPFFATLCRDNGIDSITLEHPSGRYLSLCASTARNARTVAASIPIQGGTLRVTTKMPIDLAAKQLEIENHIHDYANLAARKKEFRNFYLLLLLLITLFVLFVATWIALFMARQISVPISALLGAAGEVRGGNLAFRVKVTAIDELATLVRAFNAMTEDLEANRWELESRRRFTEAILESIPTAVISLSSEGRIQRVNRALQAILPQELVERAGRLEDIFSRDDTAEIKYLMKRARRTGYAATELELQSQGNVRHVSVTISALEENLKSGFVMVLEDTSELLRAQKAAAWHEVAQRIAHELKNPLTPIALCAERIGRQIDRGPVTVEGLRILRECSATITREVESVKTLVDEFSQFSRFPRAQPAPSDLNEIVRNALHVFEGRLDGIEQRLELGELPMVNVDPEQFKRVVVNLVDNAAEAMQDSLVKQLYVATRSHGDSVELMIADTGCGVSAEDKEKLFLPYFSTKGRGTGLGLAIVSHILADHNAQIRVEDNRPSGALFLVEVPAIAGPETEPESKAIESAAS